MWTEIFNYLTCSIGLFKMFCYPNGPPSERGLPHLYGTHYRPLYGWSICLLYCLMCVLPSCGVLKPSVSVSVSCQIPSSRHSKSVKSVPKICKTWLTKEWFHQKCPKPFWVMSHILIVSIGIVCVQVPTGYFYVFVLGRPSEARNQWVPPWLLWATCYHRKCPRTSPRHPFVFALW